MGSGERTGAAKQGAGRGLALALALASALAATGCMVFWVGAGAAAGVAGVAYVKGELRATVDADPRAVERATVKAFEEMDIRYIKSSSSAVDAEVSGRTATDRKIAVNVKSEEDGKSALSIRVGTFGDQTLSRRVFDEIQKHLPEAQREMEQE